MTASVVETASSHSAGEVVSLEASITPEEILRIAAAIKSACGLTEERFLVIGRKLGSSIESLERLTTLFSNLQVELDSPEMRSATEGLARVATQISVLAGAQRDERAALEQLSRISAGLSGRIDEIQNEFRTIDVLTVNARITASSMGRAGSDFLTYIGEIGQSLKVTETNLRHFRDDLLQVSNHLRTVGASEAELDARQAATIAVIPQQLSRSIGLITTRRQAAAAAAGTVSAQSQQVSNGIARVISALQIGDATRQRMEHAQEAAELLARIVADDRSPADAHEPWAALSDRDRQALVADGCVLQSAQLIDAADEFSREVAAAQAELAQLSKGAHEIVRLSKETFGSTGHGGGAFLDELEADVRRAHEVIEGFHASRVGADRTMGAVLEIMTRLAEHISTVRKVEAEIRIMGVNATLKSSRLGSLGAALRVIAEDVTRSSARTAAEAKAATADLDNIVVTARSLGGPKQTERLAEITAVTARMNEATVRLRGLAGGLASALGALGRDGMAAAKLLDDTAASLTVTEEIDAAMRLAAEDFTAIAATAPPSSSEAADASGQVYQLIAARYTMGRERDIHAMYAPASGTAAAPAAALQTNIDDMLF